MLLVTKLLMIYSAKENSVKVHLLTYEISAFGSWMVYPSLQCAMSVQE